MSEQTPAPNPFASPLASSNDYPSEASLDTDMQLLRNSLSFSNVWLYILAAGMIPLGLLSLATPIMLLFRGTQLLSSATLYYTITESMQALIMIVLAVLMIFWAMAIGRFRSRPNHEALEQLLQAQARFWRISGIGFLLMIFLAIFRTIIIYT